jgi:type II secretory pathway pseudopilin PulG
MRKASERGFTLMEVLIAVGMIVLLTVAGFGLSLSMKPLELSAATMQFDATLESARSIAAAFSDGATVFVSTAPGSTNFRAQVYGNRPGGSLPLAASTVPVLDSKATITETSVLHDPAFAVIIHGNGNIGARANFAVGDAPVGPELNCPSPQNALIFQFTVNGQKATRTLPCHIDLAASGPIVIETPPSPSATPTGAPFAPPSFTPAPIIGFPGCPSGTAFVLTTGNCRYPLAASPTELHFFNTSDTSPGVYDSTGNFVNFDNGALVTASEKDYFLSYTVDTSQCSSMLTINPPSPIGPDTTGQGLSFAIQPVANPPAYNNCNLSVSDGNIAPSLPIIVSIAGPLRAKADGTENVLPESPAIGVVIPFQGTSWLQFVFNATKDNYSGLVSIKSATGCASNLSQPIQVGASQQPTNGIARTALTLTATATTFDAQGNDHPCSLSITDQPPASSTLPETIVLNISVPRLLFPPPPPPPPPPGCRPDAFGFCIISDVFPPRLDCKTDGGLITKESMGMRTVTIFGDLSAVPPNFISGGLAVFTFPFTDDGTGNCTPDARPELWSPGEPSQVLGDPLLP